MPKKCLGFKYIEDMESQKWLSFFFGVGILSLKNPHSLRHVDSSSFIVLCGSLSLARRNRKFSIAAERGAGADGYAACSPLSVPVSPPLPYLFATAIPIASIISPPIAPTSQIYLYPSFPMESSQLPQTV